MSKYMQISVSVKPHYGGELEKTYPRLARHLGYLNAALVQRNPSLYELAAGLDKLLYAFEGTTLREVLLRHREKLKSLHENIEGNIANWNLSQADRLLYKLEDIFDEIETELS
jgi:uncharacterized protein YicC (UPF0701 family)